VVLVVCVCVCVERGGGGGGGGQIFTTKKPADPKIFIFLKKQISCSIRKFSFATETENR